MNEIEKAIEYIQLLIEIQLNATRAMIHHNGRKKLGKSYLREMGQRITNYHLAIKALEKQTALPVKFKVLEKPVQTIKHYSGQCPFCNAPVTTHYHMFSCGICGQKLNWEVKDGI